MSKQWNEWQWNGRDFIAPDGRVYTYGQDDEQLDARLNAMQAVVEAAKKLSKITLNEDDQFESALFKLDATLNQLEAKK
jgi:hypothetical protein